MGCFHAGDTQQGLKPINHGPHALMALKQAAQPFTRIFLYYEEFCFNCAEVWCLLGSQGTDLPPASVLPVSVGKCLSSRGSRAADR